MSDIEATISEMEIDGDPILAYYAGRLRESLRKVPDGYVLLPRRLTAANGAKGLLSGEFAAGFEMNCGECDSVDEDAAQHCDVCSGHGTYRVDVPVGWDTIKNIYRMIVDNLAVEVSPAPPTSGECSHDFRKGTVANCIHCGWSGYADPSTPLATPAQAGAVLCQLCYGDRWMKDGTPCPSCNRSGRSGHAHATPAQGGAELPEIVAWMDHKGGVVTAAMKARDPGMPYPTPLTVAAVGNVCDKLRPGAPCPTPESCRENGCSAVEREIYEATPGDRARNEAFNLADTVIEHMQCGREQEARAAIMEAFAARRGGS